MHYFSLCSKKSYPFLVMDGSKAGLPEKMAAGLDATEEEYASKSNLLQEFVNISTIDKAWAFKSADGMNIMDYI